MARSQASAKERVSDRISSTLKARQRTFGSGNAGTGEAETGGSDGDARSRHLPWPIDSCAESLALHVPINLALRVATVDLAAGRHGSHGEPVGDLHRSAAPRLKQARKPRLHRALQLSPVVPTARARLRRWPS